MKTKTILNTSGALITLGGAAVGSYYALNAKSTKPSLNGSKEQKSPKPKIRKPILEWLKSKTDRPMLPTNDVQKDGKWNNKWEKFKVWYETHKDNKHWQIFDWDQQKNTGGAYSHLKRLCGTNSEQQTDEPDPQLVDEVIMHCIEDSE